MYLPVWQNPVLGYKGLKTKSVSQNLLFVCVFSCTIDITKKSLHPVQIAGFCNFWKKKNESNSEFWVTVKYWKLVLNATRISKLRNLLTFLQDQIENSIIHSAGVSSMVHSHFMPSVPEIHRNPDQEIVATESDWVRGRHHSLQQHDS